VFAPEAFGMLADRFGTPWRGDRLRVTSARRDAD
jgi:hypothetical protein